MINSEIIKQCKNLIRYSDTVLIGAGAGLSTAAGLEYGGKRFRENFPDFIEKYGLTDMYSSAFYQFPSLEEYWAYFSRHIHLNRYSFGVGELYTKLLSLVKDKNYFVLTTNGDSQFELAGFEPKQLFATQGDYSKFQCAKACHDTLYDNKEMVEAMVSQQSDFKIPSELIPICPVCGENLVTHLRIDQYFVENDNWHEAASNYEQYIKEARDKKLVMIELGVGFNTPGIIRLPFEQLSIEYPESILIRVNKDNIQAYHNIPEKSILLQADIVEFINGILN